MSDWQTTGTETGTAAEGNYIVDSDIDNWADGISVAVRLATIQRAEALIEKVTKDYFYAKAFAIYKDGNGKDRLFLGLVPDILSVTEIKISGIALSTSWWTYDVNSVFLDPEAVAGDVDGRVELHLRLKHEYALFPKGMGNIKLTGTYGWSTCPAAIKQAAIILCRYDNDSTLYTDYDDVVSDKLADGSYSRGDKRFLTGIHEADNLIRNYIRRKPMLGAV